MEPFQLAYENVLAGPDGFEGTILHPYLDTHTPPLVTASVGCAITLPEALTVNWLISGQPATGDQISRNYLRVQNMKGGMLASAYWYPGCLTLTDAEAMKLLDKRVTSATVLLRAMFPAFDQYPEPAKTGLLEMPFSLGPFGFQHSYPEFRAAVARAGDSQRSPAQHQADWQTAAKECRRNTWDTRYDRRNDWLESMLLQAAALAGPTHS